MFQTGFRGAGRIAQPLSLPVLPGRRQMDPGPILCEITAHLLLPLLLQGEAAAHALSPHYRPIITVVRLQLVTLTLDGRR